MNTEELIEKINKFEALLNEYGQLNYNIWELRQSQKAIFEGFKTAVFNNNDERQNIFDKFNNLNQALNIKQESVNKDNEKFAAEADMLIAKLSEKLDFGIINNQPTKEDMAEFKLLVNAIFNFFKQNRWPNKESRELNWQKFEPLRERVKIYEDVFYKKLKEIAAKRSEKSVEITQKVIAAINECNPELNVETLPESLALLLTYLKENNLNAEVFNIEIDAEKLQKPLKLKTETINLLRKLINDNRDEFTRDDKDKIYAKLDEIQVTINKAWEDYKAEAQQKQQAWEERKLLNEQKRAEWEVKQKDFLQKLEIRLGQQIAYNERLEKGEQSQQDFLQKLQNRLQSQQDYLPKLAHQIIELEEKQASAWSDAHREKIGTWIEEKNVKIAEINNDVLNMQDKITEVQKNIEDLPAKKLELEISIAEIKLKIEEVNGLLLASQ